MLKNYVIFWGGGGGHQKITLDYRGKGGGRSRESKKGLRNFLMVPKHRPWSKVFHLDSKSNFGWVVVMLNLNISPKLNNFSLEMLGLTVIIWIFLSFQCHLHFKVDIIFEVIFMTCADFHFTMQHEYTYIYHQWTSLAAYSIWKLPYLTLENKQTDICDFWSKGPMIALAIMPVKLV